MSSIHSIINEVTAAAEADAGGDNPRAHATLLQCIQKLMLAAEKPLETAKRILYQVSSFCQAKSTSRFLLLTCRMN